MIAGATVTICTRHRYKKGRGIILGFMPPLHCVVVAGSAERRRLMEDAWRGAGQVIVPARDAEEAANALTAPGLDVLAVDLALPLLDRAALQRAISPALTHPPESLEAAERRHIALTLAYTGGNRRQAARLLGIARSTMLAKLRKYGLESIGGTTGSD